MRVSPARIEPTNARIQNAIDKEKSHRMSLNELRSGNLFYSGSDLRIGSWNVEHLPLKIIELQIIMIERHLTYYVYRKRIVVGRNLLSPTKVFL